MKATLFASLVAQAAGFGAMPMMCEDGPLVFDVSDVRAAIDNEDCDEMIATIKAQVEAIPKAPGSDIPSPQCTTAALSMPEIAGMLCEVFPFFNIGDPGSVCGITKGMAFLDAANDVLGSEGVAPFMQAFTRCEAGGADNDAADNDAGDSASNECVDVDATSLSTVIGSMMGGADISCASLKMQMPSMCDQDSVASVCCATCSS